jgi:hypothetical protein
MRTATAIRRACTARRAMATLEFVMALPVLLLLMVGITWLGFSVIARSEALVQARDKAWQKRFDNPKQKPLIFPTGISAVQNPRYSQAGDYVTESVTKPVDVSPVFKAVPAPKGTHTILAGSWDHRALDMNSPPNFKLYADAGLNAATGALQTALSTLKGLSSQLASFGGETLAKQLASVPGLGSPGSQPSTAAAQDKQNTDQQKQVDRGAIDQQLTQKRAELDQVTKQINDLEGKSTANQNTPQPNDPNQQKQQEEAKKATNRNLQFLKDKKQRLETEIRDLQDRRNSLN